MLANNFHRRIWGKERRLRHSVILKRVDRIISGIDTPFVVGIYKIVSPATSEPTGSRVDRQRNGAMKTAVKSGRSTRATGSGVVTEVVPGCCSPPDHMRYGNAFARRQIAYYAPPGGGGSDRLPSQKAPRLLRYRQIAARLNGTVQGLRPPP